MNKEIVIERLEGQFSVCTVTDYSKVNLEQPYVFIGVTDVENSLVCRTECVPDNTVERNDGWRGFRIQGSLDFSLIGILAGIAKVLADHSISIFAVSTFDTDYIFVREERYKEALEALKDNGYRII